MTLDRTKKYKVGEVVFRASCEYSSNEWSTEINGYDYYFTEDRFLKLNPVEVEEPLKWSVETGGGQFGWIGDSYFSAMFKSKAGQPLEGHWRHEVVSTRIG